MKLKQIAALVALVWSPLFVVDPAQSGNTEEDDKTKNAEGEGIVSFVLEGQKAGKRVFGAMDKATTTAREVLSHWGEKFAEFQTERSRDEAMSLWLDGYAQAWANKDSAKVNKAWAKSVLLAFCIKGELSPQSLWTHRKDDKGNLLYFIDADKGDVEGNVTTDSKIGKYAVIDKPKAKSAELLKNFKGGFGEWVKFAGKLNKGDGVTGASNTSTGQQQQASGSPGRTRVMTTGQHTDILDRIPTANADQLSSVIEKSTAQLAARDNSELLLFREIAHIANVLKAKAKDAAMIEIAANIFDQAEGAVARLQVAAAGKAPVPQPATGGKAPEQAQSGKVEQSAASQLRTGTGG